MMVRPADHIGPINLGNPVELTMVEPSDWVMKLTDSKPKPVRKPLPQDDPRQQQPDITRAAQLLCWQPTIALTSGLKQTIAYFVDLFSRRTAG